VLDSLRAQPIPALELGLGVGWCGLRQGPLPVFSIFISHRDYYSIPDWADCIQICSPVLVYKCLHWSAPAYLTDELYQVADVEARQRLRSSSSSSLTVSRTRLSTVGDQAFPVAAARVWNSLPDLVTSAPSVAIFRSQLKTHPFNISYTLPPCDCTVPTQ